MTKAEVVQQASQEGCTYYAGIYATLEEAALAAEAKRKELGFLT